MKEQGEQNVLKINPLFEPLFLDYLDQPRYYQIYGGRGSGKSFTVSVASVLKTYSRFKHKILYLRQTMSSSEDSTIADVRAAIHLLGKAKDFRESKGVITNMTTGATISFKGIKSTGGQTAKLKSLSGITTLIIEEAEELESFDEFSKVDESIRIAGKPLAVILIYNPGASIGSWIHKEWFIEGYPKPERHSDTMYIHSTYLDNLDNMNPSVIKRYRDLERTNPIYYINTILAEWTLEASGRLYAGWEHWASLLEEGDTWYGMDFGYGGDDKTACVKVTWIDGVYYIEQMFSIAKLTIQGTVTAMRRAGIPFNAKIYADSAMPLLITEIRAGGFSSIRKATKGNVEAGIKKIQDKSITLIGDNDSDLYKSYMTFRRDKKGKLPHEPDSLAAMRYAINSKSPTRKPSRNLKRAARRKVRRGFI
jgi:phage terminase large subunit